MFTGIELNDGTRIPSIKGQVFKLKQNSTLFDVGVPKGEYTMPINLAKDDKTMLALGLQHRINHKDKFTRTPCKLFTQGIFVRNALLVVEEIAATITGYLLTGMSTLAEQMRTTYLDDVDYGPIIVPGTTEAEMVAHMKDTVDNPSNHNHVFASIVSRGFNENFVNKQSFYKEDVLNFSINSTFKTNTITRVNNSAHIPFPYLVYILKKIHEYFGYTIQWPLMEDSTFEKIIFVNNRSLLENAFLNDLKLKSNTNTMMIPTNGEDAAFADGVTGYVQSAKLREEDILPYSGSAGLIPGSVLEFDNLLIDIDSPSPYTNTDDQLNTSNGKYLIRAAGKMSLTIDFDASIIEAGSGTYTYTGDVAQLYFLELSINGVRLAYNLVYFDLSMPLIDYYDTYNYVISLVDVVINANDIGQYIDFKIGAYGEFVNEESNDTHFLLSNVFNIKVNDLEIDHSKMDVFQIPSYDINYANHLEHKTCSEFLASIRNRFGAYVQNVNFEDKIITYAQLKDVANGVVKNRFNLRDEEFSDKFIEQSHKWKYNFDTGEENFWSKFYNKTIGDADAEITHNEYSFDMGPVFYEYHKNYLYIASKEMVGISKSNANTEVTNYLALYHGLRDRGDGIDYPTATSRNDINDGIVGSTEVIATPWGLHWRETDGLYATFLEGFWKYFVEYMEIEFTTYPDVVEILNFKYENVDFYHFMKFLVKEIDFEIGQEGIRPTKAVMVKLDL